MNEITIFIATYNRACTLERLYYSLLMQTNQQFIWLIVDDGSTDTTKELIQQFIAEEKIKIIYIHQTNKGKNQAFNLGVQHTNTTLLFSLDSDDWLVDTAIEQIYNIHSQYQDRSIGYVFQCLDMKNNILTKKFPSNPWFGGFYSLYFKENIRGDTAIIFKTDVIKSILSRILRENNLFQKLCYIID